MFLRQTPKLFFFNCCRESIFHQIFKQNIFLIFIFINILIESSSVGAKQSEKEKLMYIKEPQNLSTIEINSHENRGFHKLTTIDEQWVNDNKDTFISYSCSEGLLRI